MSLEQFEALFSLFQGEGYQILGPTLKDQAIVYDALNSPHDLPIGWTDVQGPGTYRLKKRPDRAYFGYNVGPHSWKKYLFPPKKKIWTATRTNGSLTFFTEQHPPQKTVFLGVRACEVAAIQVQDKVFLEGKFVDSYYRTAREGALIVAVNCTQAAPTCFCTSMQTGPKAQQGYDLSLTEILQGGQHYFLIDAGSEQGEAWIARLELNPCEAVDVEHADRAIQHAINQMAEGLGVNTDQLNTLLYRNLEHPQWEKTAERCLSCANCTLACPTCFCSTIEDTTDLTGNHTERWVSWDSCFNQDHSYIHGGEVRHSTKSRYRQWLTHKVGSWIDQFGVSGCVGCGRCIAWCPVGIDLREELAAIRETDAQGASS